MQQPAAQQPQFFVSADTVNAPLAQAQPPQHQQGGIQLPVGILPAPSQDLLKEDDEDSVPFGVPSCKHNNWDNVRVKKGIVTLSCRDCHKKWKQHHPIPMLCPDFYSQTCPFGPHCPYLHVHRFKSRAKSPNPTGYVEGTERDELFYNCAKEVLSSHPPNTPPTAVHSEVINLYIHRQQNGANAEAPKSQAPAPQPKQTKPTVVQAQQAQPQQVQPAQQQFIVVQPSTVAPQTPAQLVQQQQPMPGAFTILQTNPDGSYALAPATTVSQPQQQAQPAPKPQPVVRVAPVAPQRPQQQQQQQASSANNSQWGWGGFTSPLSLFDRMVLK